MVDVSQTRRDSRRKRRKPGQIPFDLREIRDKYKLSIKDLIDLMPPREDGERWVDSTVSRFETGGRGASPELITAFTKAIKRAKELDRARQEADP